MNNITYSNYVWVDPDFIPVFSGNSDIIYPNKWKSFYPHDSFKKILHGIVDMLEKGSIAKDLSQWMYGAYGTGKTYASFTIKHLLEDPLDSVNSYFEQNGLETLWNRIQGIRVKGNILVVHKSSSAGINTQNKLFNTITTSVKDALVSKGYTYFGASSRYDKILATLKDKNSSFNFNAVFTKYHSKFTEYQNIEQIINDLESKDINTDEKIELLDRIIDVAEEEAYNWSTTPNEVVSWLNDVREKNNIQAIVFIWDEFTEYFKNNQNNITGLQEIAMASPRINFYFFLITHSDINQLIMDKAASKIMQARFILQELVLGENTALTLLGNALHVDNNNKIVWEKVKSALWFNIQNAVKYIEIKDKSIKESDFVTLLPMHPYASYLLNYISQNISSNQRTMFQFLSGDYKFGESERKNFKWFINNVCYDENEENGWNYLTVDLLWDYFFFESNVDFDSAFIDVINHYTTFFEFCDTEQRLKVFKVALLLIALHVKQGGSNRSRKTSLLRPTLKNIRACFIGTPMQDDVLEELNYLIDRGMLGSLDDFQDTIYVMNSVSVDKARMDEKREDARRQFAFDKILKDANAVLQKQLIPNVAFLRCRYSFEFLTTTNAKDAVNGINVENNVVPVFIIFAKNESEEAKFAGIKDYIFNKYGSECLIIDFTTFPFTDERFERYIDSKAKEGYFNELRNHNDQVKLARKNCENIVSEWTNSLLTITYRVYTSINNSTQLTNPAALKKILLEVNDTLYPYGAEKICDNEKLFSPKGYKEIVAKIGMGRESIPANYGYLRLVINALDKDGIWNSNNYWIVNPNHIVSKMKTTVDNFIWDSFNKDNVVRILDIWTILQKRPYGLLPNTGSAFLLGFLLKEYADSNFYKQDYYKHTVPLNSSDLSDIIYGVVKGLPKAKDQFIVRQKSSHVVFCEKTGEIFKIAKENRGTISDISANIYVFLTHNIYPLWSIIYYLEEFCYEDSMCDIMIETINKLCDFVDPVSSNESNKTKIAEEIYELYANNSGLEIKLGNIINIQCMKQGMLVYIIKKKPELNLLVNSLGMNSDDSLILLSKKLSNDASYLWKKEEIDSQINSLFEELQLVQSINNLLADKKKDLSGAINALKNRLAYIKFPLKLIEEYSPDLSNFIYKMNSLVNRKLNYNVSLITTISGYAQDFNDFINNQSNIFIILSKKYIDSSIDNNEIDYLFDKIQVNALNQDLDAYIITLKEMLASYRRNKKKNVLFKKWEEVSGGSSSPQEWSKRNGFPILCLFIEDSQFDSIRKMFDILNDRPSLVDDEQIDNAITFLSSSKIDILNDTNMCNSLFIKYFCGDYSMIIDDPSVLREILRNVIGNNVYNWFFHRDKAKNEIIQKALYIYIRKYQNIAKKQVHKLTAQEAHLYLEQLVEDNPLLGIKIMKDVSYRE